MDVNSLASQLRIDEGVRYSAYNDSLGYTTIGVGHLIDARKGGKISDNIVNQILVEDIAGVVSDLNAHLPWWASLSEGRQEVLANMCFNMGIQTLLTFTTFLNLVQSGQYTAAAQDMLQTKWAAQVGVRATRLSGIMQNDQSVPTVVSSPSIPATPPLPAPTSSLQSVEGDSLFNTLQDMIGNQSDSSSS